MKSRWIPSLTVFVTVICVLAVSVSVATGVEADQLAQPSCRYCGMDRSKFALSRFYITYDDGTRVGTCSLHCAAIDLSLKIDKIPVTIMVADYNTKKLIDAETAQWVTGGSIMGVMTRRAKWAFASPADAKAFMAAHGGSAGSFSGAIEAAFEDMYDDLKMIRAKRQKMKAKKGP